jgi:peptide/nickel transport system substrate-binding protein
LDVIFDTKSNGGGNKMVESHPVIKRAQNELHNGRMDRREFLRIATLLGMAAPAAYAISGLPGPAYAQEAPKRGGTLRMGMRITDLSSPHTYGWIEPANIARQVVEYLTYTDAKGVTHPGLLAGWEASDDLKTWTLKVRRNVKWRDGRDFTADDVVWNLMRVLDPKVGSSTIGLFKGFLLETVDEGKKDANGKSISTTKLWDPKAIEKIDDYTVRLNGKSGSLAVPESLFHYPLLILDPKEGGKFGVGSNGTGPFELVELKVGQRAVLKARRSGYWGEPAYLDTVEIVDLGDEAAAQIAALASGQVDLFYQGSVSTMPAVQTLPGVDILMVDSANTGVARVHPKKPFDDKRVRQALRISIDPKATLQAAYRGLGQPGESHHVSRVHPEYADVGQPPRDIEKAKRLLADAGYPNGIDTEITCRPQPDWELLAVQSMVEQWKDAGIRVKINVVPSTQYWDSFMNFPFSFTSWAHRPLGTMILGLTYRTGAPWNESQWSNAEFDALLTEAEGYLDVNRRREVMAKLEQIMLDDGPAVIPLWRSLFTYARKNVKGVQLHPSLYYEFRQMWLQS